MNNKKEIHVKKITKYLEDIDEAIAEGDTEREAKYKSRIDKITKAYYPDAVGIYNLEDFLGEIE